MDKRGALIVFEGCDRVGKTTQLKLTRTALQSKEYKAAILSFPCRTTHTGNLINLYLNYQLDYSNECIHLLFSLNRWELKKKMEELLLKGTTIIVDRYSYSGIAYSMANGLELDWAKNTETGLIKPDLVLYLMLPAEQIESRLTSDEIYENLEFQKKVTSGFEKLFDETYWKKVDASATEQEVNNTCLDYITKCIDNINDTKINYFE